MSLLSWACSLCSCSFPQWISSFRISNILVLRCNLGFSFPAPCSGFSGSFFRESNNYSQCLDSRAFCSLGTNLHDSFPLASSMPDNDTAGTALHGSHSSLGQEWKCSFLSPILPSLGHTLYIVATPCWQHWVSTLPHQRKETLPFATVEKKLVWSENSQACTGQNFSLL